MSSELRDCSVCKNTRHVYCPTCDGSGFVINHNNQIKNCWVCHGTTQISCPSCMPTNSLINTEDIRKTNLRAGFSQDISRGQVERSADQDEYHFLKAVLRYLRFRGCFVWRNKTGSYITPEGQTLYFGQRGSPDILGVAPGGRIICIEGKSGQGQLTDEQRAFLLSIHKAGGIARVVRPEDYKQVIDKALSIKKEP